MNMRKVAGEPKMNLQVPQGLKVENSIVNGFEVSWSPVAGEGISYFVEMANSDSPEEIPKIVYNGPKTSCLVDGLDAGAEYVFRVRSVSGNTMGEWSGKIAKNVEPPSVEVTVNTLKKFINDGEACEKILKGLVELTENGKLATPTIKKATTMKERTF